MRVDDDDEEKYITDDCAIKDQNYKAFEKFILCDFCKKILRSPMMCKSCQKVFCKKCKDKWAQSCEKCQNPEYVVNNDKSVMLSMISFLCKNCKSEVKYNDIESHLKSGCIKNNDTSTNQLMNAFTNKKKLTKLSKEEVSEITKKGIKINRITGK